MLLSNPSNSSNELEELFRAMFLSLLHLLLDLFFSFLLVLGEVPNPQCSEKLMD